MKLCAGILLTAFSVLTAIYPPLPEPGISLVKSTLPGVIDIYYDGQLVNNLVAIVAFDGHYNSSEIQRSEVTLTAESIDYAPFDECEPQHPASHACIHLDYRIEGDTLHITANQPIGLGLFFGVYHGVMGISLSCGERLRPRRVEPTPYFALGHFDCYTASGFTLHSIYDPPDICVRALDGQRVDIETRNCPWRPEHELLRTRLCTLSGMEEWFEAGIAFGSGFEVTLQPHSPRAGDAVRATGRSQRR